MLGPSMTAFATPFALGFSVYAARGPGPRVPAMIAVVLSALQLVGMAAVAAMLTLDASGRVSQ